MHHFDAHARIRPNFKEKSKGASKKDETKCIAHTTRTPKLTKIGHESNNYHMF